MSMTEVFSRSMGKNQASRPYQLAEEKIPGAGITFGRFRSNLESFYPVPLRQPSRPGFLFPQKNNAAAGLRRTAALL